MRPGGRMTVKNAPNNPEDQRPDLAAEERQRIARELHDRVLQLLSGARLRAETVRRQLLDDRTALETELRAVEESIDKAITEIRNLLTESQSEEELQAGSLERRL